MKREDLVRLIRKIAKEQTFEVLDEHLEDYEHEEKELTVEEVEAE